MYSYLKKSQELFKGKSTDKIKKLLFSQYTGVNEKLIIPIGYVDGNEPVYMNFSKVHGLFIGGATGTGKSVLLDTIILLLMAKNTSNEVKFLFIDPKKVELGEYNGLDYIMTRYKRSITNPKKALEKLIGLLRIIEERVNILMQQRIKSINTYNKNNSEKWPHIFVVFDESSDIMQMDNAQEVIEQILDYGKPVGVHVILATNTYLRKYYHTKFIDHFKYRVSFDMASYEQAKYMEIEGCDLLKGSGHGLIKCPNSRIYNFESLFTPDKVINGVVESLKGK